MIEIVGAPVPSTTLMLWVPGSADDCVHPGTSGSVISV
jgi:hypothetical protein